MVGRILNRVAKAAGIGHVHPHQLRHTLATQAINRGMRLEAIAALLGHRSLRMTMLYARIANRTVADEYHAVTDQVDALYAEPALSDKKTPASSARGTSTAACSPTATAPDPSSSTAASSPICEGCGPSRPPPSSSPFLRQRDHARDQTRPADSLYDEILTRLDPSSPDPSPPVVGAARGPPITGISR